MGIDFFNLLQPPVKQKAPVPDVIQVIPANPADISPQVPTTADQAFQAILDKALGLKTPPGPVSVENSGISGQGGIMNSPALPGVTGGGGNNLFNFFSEAGVVYIVGAILVGVAFVMLRK